MEWIKTAFGNNVMIKRLLRQNKTADVGSETRRKRLNVKCLEMIKTRAAIYFDDRNDNPQWFVL